MTPPSLSHHRQGHQTRPRSPPIGVFASTPARWVPACSSPVSEPNPCPWKPRAVSWLCHPSLASLPALQSYSTFLVPPHGAKRDHVTHQNGKGQLTPKNLIVVSSTGLGTCQSTTIQSPTPSARLGGEVLQGWPPSSGGPSC